MWGCDMREIMDLIMFVILRNGFELIKEGCLIVVSYEDLGFSNNEGLNMNGFEFM